MERWEGAWKEEWKGDSGSGTAATKAVAVRMNVETV